MQHLFYQSHEIDYIIQTVCVSVVRAEPFQWTRPAGQPGWLYTVAMHKFPTAGGVVCARLFRARLANATLYYLHSVHLRYQGSGACGRRLAGQGCYGQFGRSGRVTATSGYICTNCFNGYVTVTHTAMWQQPGSAV